MKINKRFWFIRKILHRNRTDPVFHARFMLYRGAVINLCFALYKMIMGIVLSSGWLMSVAGYYGILTVLKYFVIRQDIQNIRYKNCQNQAAQWRMYRNTGYMMLLLNIGLVSIMGYVLFGNRSFSYPGFLIYAMAVFTFYRITAAIVRFLKDRKKAEPVFGAARMIDISFAVIAVFVLQTAMFSSFSPDMDVRLPNFITGISATLIVTGIAISMVITGVRNGKYKKGINTYIKK